MCCMASAMSDLLKPHWSKNSSCQRVIAAGALTTGGLAQWFVARSCSTLSPVSAGMDDRIRAGIPPRYVTKPTRSTQRCIPLGSLNRVPALIGWSNGGNVTSAGWQVTLCDPMWHVSSRRGAVLVAQTACYTLPYLALIIYLACRGCTWQGSVDGRLSRIDCGCTKTTASRG